MLWFIMGVFCTVCLAISGLIVLCMVLNWVDEVEPTYNAPPPAPPAKVPGPGVPGPRHGGGKIVNIPIDAIRDDQAGCVQIAQDRIPAPRRESGPPAAPLAADAACDEPGAFILPFGEVEVYPHDICHDCPHPIEAANPAPPAEADFGGMGGGNTIGDVGGDW